MKYKETAAYWLVFLFWVAKRTPGEGELAWLAAPIPEC